MGEVVARARIEGRHPLLRAGGPDALPRRARFQHRRLRLHDVHRELGAAARGDLRGDRRGRPRRLLGALRQPELRGAHPPGGEGELPRLAAARRRLRARRPDGLRVGGRADRHRPGRRGGLPARPLADLAGDQRGHRLVRPQRDVLLHLRRRLHRRRHVARARGAVGRALRMGAGLDLHPAPSVLRRHARRAEPGRRHRRRALPRRARRLGDDRPHLAGGRDQAGFTRRALPGRARRRAPRLQLLRLTPRQPRGDGARHVRERAPAKPARAGLGRHLDRARPERRRD